MPDVIRETDEYVRYDMSFDDIIDAAEQVEAAAEGYTDLDTRLDGMDNEIDQAKQAIHFKGFVNYYADLPDDAEENDAYTVLYSGTTGTDPDGTEYVYSNYGGELSWNPWGKQTYSQSQIDTFLSAKQDTVTAGTGLAFGTGADANTLGHSNAVTAKATQGFAQIAYDAQGHITGSTAATTAQVNAINSGIDSTKVAQIETNKTNILLSGKRNPMYQLIEPNGLPRTYSPTGATVTINVDNSVTVNATNSHSVLAYEIGTVTLKANTQYICTGAPSGSSDSTYFINIDFGASNVNVSSDYIFTLDSDRNATIIVYVRPNIACDKTFYPMILEKSAYDAGFTEFQPYSLPNTELTSKVLLAEQQTGYNRINVPDTTLTQTGFVANQTDIVLKGGVEYILMYTLSTACNINFVGYATKPASASSKSYDIQYSSSDGTGTFRKHFTPSADTVCTSIYCNITASTTMSNVCIYPASLGDVPFQTYAMTNAELTEKVAINENKFSTTSMASIIYNEALAQGYDTNNILTYMLSIYTATDNEYVCAYGVYKHGVMHRCVSIVNNTISISAFNNLGTIALSGGTAPYYAKVRFF